MRVRVLVIPQGLLPRWLEVVSLFYDLVDSQLLDQLDLLFNTSLARHEIGAVLLEFIYDSTLWGVRLSFLLNCCCFPEHRPSRALQLGLRSCMNG